MDRRALVARCHRQCVLKLLPGLQELWSAVPDTLQSAADSGVLGLVLDAVMEGERSTAIHFQLGRQCSGW